MNKRKEKKNQKNNNKLRDFKKNPKVFTQLLVPNLEDILALGFIGMVSP